MRLVLTEYLASLRERDELDVLIPNLLSQIGLNVFSTPLQGGREYGVDVGAVGKIDSGETKVYLFSIKAGDLDRTEWNSAVQALRPSMDEIIDTYIDMRLPSEYKKYPIVICPCFGGRMRTEVRENYEGYVRQNSSEKISFQEWNGEKIAEKLERHLLDETLFIRNDKEVDFRSLLRKSLSMVEEPKTSFKYFNQIIELLCRDYEKHEQVLTALRQLYLANGILFNWAKSDNNIKSALISSERSLLYAWDMVKKYQNDNKKTPTQIKEVFQRLMGLYVSILEHYHSKFITVSQLQFGVSWLIRANCDVDVNLKLFEIIGHLSLSGLWLYFLYENLANNEEIEMYQELLQTKVNVIKNIILNNPLSYSPYSEDQTIDLMLLILFLMKTDNNETFITEYLTQMSNQIGYLFSTGGKYPSIFTEYRDLFHHPKERTEEYLEEATSGSISYPFMQLISSLLEIDNVYNVIEKSRLNFLKKCTFQIWFPDDFSEDHYMRNSDLHGKAFIPMNKNEVPIEKYKKIIEAEIEEADFLEELSAIKAGIYPLILTASRHHRIPVPPQFFIKLYESA